VSQKAQASSRQRNLTIVLAVVLLIATWHFLGPRLGFGGNDVATVQDAHPAADSGENAQPRTVRHVRSGHLGTRPGERVAVLHLADLDRAPKDSARGRDLWSFVNPPRPQIPPLQPQPKQQVPVAEAPLPKTTPPPPHPADFNLQYLGRFGPRDKQIAVFTKGSAVLNRQEGEVIDNQFIVAHIGYESVDIRFVGFPDAPAKRIGLTRRH
jgi:hypothetical protein